MTNLLCQSVAVGAGARAHGVARAAREAGTVLRVPFSRRWLAGTKLADRQALGRNPFLGRFLGKGGRAGVRCR